MYDIIIIGCGSAGMMCALMASQRNKKVLVIEKSDKVGGTLHITAGHLSAGGTNRQKTKGIEDTPTLHYEDIMRISKDTANPEIVKLATEKAPELINWLEANGYIFDQNCPSIIYGHVPYSIPRTHFGGADYAGKTINGAGTAVLDVIMPLWESELKKGNISLLLNHRLNGFEKNQDLVISINLISKKITKNIKVNNAKVVVTTGGYAANHDFFGSVHPDAPRLITTAKETSTGDGHQSLMKLGAKFVGSNKHSSTLGGIELTPNSGRTDFWKVWARVSNAHDRKPREIYINSSGKRFMNEDEVNADVRERKVLKQDGRKFWVIFDKNALENGDSIIPQWQIEQIEAEAKQEKAIWKADSITELANKIKIENEQLCTTIKQFNQNVTSQNDTEFGRTFLQNKIDQGPYYAVLTYAFSLISFGGIAVNHELKVKKSETEVFQNLYAAGEILGAGATSGSAFCGGMLLTPALSFGKYLGETL